VSISALFLMTGHTGNPSTQEDPMIYIPLNLDRLRLGVSVLCDLMSFEVRSCATSFFVGDP